MKDFQIEPKRTRDDLEEAIKNRATRLQRLQELKAPPIIQENEQRILGELMTELREGNWAITDAEIKYGKAWYARAEAFTYKETV
jgi:DNA-directed RNA polymerase beta' subunit